MTTYANEGTDNRWQDLIGDTSDLPDADNAAFWCRVAESVERRQRIAELEAAIKVIGQLAYSYPASELTAAIADVCREAMSK